MAETPTLSYCATQVRQHDRERFLTCLFAPADRREGLFALYAFNHEVAKTAETVSEPMLGEIRLQWWREAVDEAFGGRPRQHQVVLALAEAVRARSLSRELLQRLIDGRARDLDSAAPANLDELEDYAEGTSATLVRLALQALGVDEAEAHRAGRHVGIAWALTGLLRAVPHHAGRRRLYLPEDHLAVAGVDRAALFELRGSQALNGVVMRLARRAEEHLAAARDLRRAVPRSAHPALLPAVLATRHLRRLRRVGYDPFDPRLAIDPRRQALPLTLASLRHRY